MTDLCRTSTGRSDKLFRWKICFGFTMKMFCLFRIDFFYCKPRRPLCCGWSFTNTRLVLFSSCIFRLFSVLILFLRFKRIPYTIVNFVFSQIRNSLFLFTYKTKKITVRDQFAQCFFGTK